MSTEILALHGPHHAAAAAGFIAAAAGPLAVAAPAGSPAWRAAAVGAPSGPPRPGSPLRALRAARARGDDPGLRRLCEAAAASLLAHARPGLGIRSVRLLAGFLADAAEPLSGHAAMAVARRGFGPQDIADILRRCAAEPPGAAAARLAAVGFRDCSAALSLAESGIAGAALLTGGGWAETVRELRAAVGALPPILWLSPDEGPPPGGPVQLIEPASPALGALALADFAERHRTAGRRAALLLDATAAPDQGALLAEHLPSAGCAAAILLGADPAALPALRGAWRSAFPLRPLRRWPAARD